MKRFWMILLTTGLGLAAFSGRATAQYGGPPSGAPYTAPGQPYYGPGYRPALSPYLNLIRGGDPAANYYLGTLPEFQRRANTQVFRSALIDLDQRAARGPALEEDTLFQPLASTGHITAFGVTGTYFGSSNPYAGAANRGQRGGAATNQPKKPQQ